MPLALWNFNDLRESIMSDEIIASIVTSEEDEEFIRKICEDLGLKSKVTMFIDPYYVHSFLGPSLNYDLKKLLSDHPIVVDRRDPTRILMEKSIYGELSDSERRVAIAHSIGHIYIFIRDNGMVGPSQDFELQANRIAIKYVSPDSVIDFYRQYGDNTPGVEILIDDLERQMPPKSTGSQ
ncbi:MAG: hypothetical protein A3D52_00310 [Candidatus Taylorbacteria bacterium RIFCSPHIGHO2_02_FULL_44_36]|nr:MAG: hypothetical protein A3D52_00310 [Candidatus Taylorbacteria bacterium RIFCSPHIGHO2_02_FULL_44_36]HXK40646.1 hypothetical protein [Candidatus Paceibacterota bacterium]